MKGISEVRLEKILRESSNEEHKFVIRWLLVECTELNPWRPIAGAPLNKLIRLFSPYGKHHEQVDGILTRDDDRKYFSHFCDLPEDPR